MPIKALLDRMPEAFVSDKSITREVSRAAQAGKLRKLASRLYTRNMTDSPEEVVARNLWHIVDGFFPGALIADRTAFELAPTDDGSVFLISDSGQDIALPGHRLRLRRGPGPLATDRPYIGGLYLSSIARAYLENLRPSRTRGGWAPRTLGRDAIRKRLEALLWNSGEDVVNRLREEIRFTAPALGLESEAAEIYELILGLLAAREVEHSINPEIARRLARPYDPGRVELFQTLHASLRDHPPVSRIVRHRGRKGDSTLTFFEAWFSNYIDGTELGIEEAVDIVFRGKIPDENPADAHDFRGTWEIVSNDRQMDKTPIDANSLELLLKSRHAAIMAGRPEAQPGAFTQELTRTGQTAFVAPELIIGTLHKGFELYRNLETPFQRAVFMMFLIDEVHPFADGNGRTARIMMNAELAAAGEERILIPIVYRANYFLALAALSQSGRPEPLIRMLDYAQRWTATVGWRKLKDTMRELEACNAFLEPGLADEEGKWLAMPGRELILHRHRIQAAP